MTTQLQIMGSSSVTLFDRFEAEFRRVYSDLYPDEAAIQEAVKYYRRDSFLLIAPVDIDSHRRIDEMRWHLNPTTLEDYYKLPKSGDSSISFADIKGAVGNRLVDIVYLSPAVIDHSTDSFYPDTMESIVGKCMVAMKKNKIEIGNFAMALWQRGMTYFDAAEQGAVSHGVEPFGVSLEEPTYQRPVLAVSKKYEEGEMLGNYFSWLNKEHGIGIMQINRDKPRIPAFSFVNRSYTVPGDSEFKFYLDRLDWR